MWLPASAGYRHGEGDRHATARPSPRPRHAGMSPGGHLVTTALTCAGVYAMTGSAALVAGVAAGGFLVDVDHVLDYVLVEGQRDFRPAAFLRFLRRAANEPGRPRAALRPVVRTARRARVGHRLGPRCGGTCSASRCTCRSTSTSTAACCRGTWCPSTASRIGGDSASAPGPSSGSPFSVRRAPSGKASSRSPSLGRRSDRRRPLRRGRGGIVAPAPASPRSIGGPCSPQVSGSELGAALGLERLLVRVELGLGHDVDAHGLAPRLEERA